MRYSIVAIATLILSACSNNKGDKERDTVDTTVNQTTDTISQPVDTAKANTGPDLAEANLLANGKAIIQLIKDGNFEEIANYVSPVSGLSFSSNGYIDKSDINFKKDQVAGLWTDSKKYKFPSYVEEDATATNITFREYYKVDVYDKDFVSAKNVALNKLQRGPTPGLFNIKEIYPTASHVDFYIPAPSDMELDWATLRLIFVNENGSWYLRHIVHDNWTP